MKEKGNHKKNTVAMVEDLLQPILKEAEVSLWDVEFVKEGASWFLRVIIEKEGGVDFQDCENVSRPLDKKLDELDFIEQSYYLEVTSPGLERALTKDWHFQRYEGEEVSVKLIRPMDGKREFIGKLCPKQGDEVVIFCQEKGAQRTFLKMQIARVKLVEEVIF